MSRLETSSESIRNQLISRNEYNPSNIYDINYSTTVDIINTTSRILRPGNGFDFSNTVIGRIIGPNTPIAVIGNQALANLYTSQVVSTLVRKNVPNINLNNLFNGKSIVEKNIDYSITKENPDTIEERIFNILRYPTGINRLSNPIPTDVTTKELLSEFTGKGQLNILGNLLSKNIYSNNFDLDSNILNINNQGLINNISINKGIISSIPDSSKYNFSDKDGKSTPLSEYFEQRYSTKFYATSGDTINQQDINKNFGNTYKIDNSLNEDIVELNKNTFTWGVDNSLSTSKGLLGYTNALFNTFNTENNPIFFNKTVSQITVNGKTYYNGIKYSDRAYSVNNQYDSISKTIRPYGNNRKNSVIEFSPIPKFIYLNDNPTKGTTNTVMFSIENLAINSETITKTNEIGPNGGRFMWFVPSILDYNEDVSPNISATNFLGRGEPVYTYANTERKLTINFYMIVDYVEDFINITSFDDFQNKIYSKDKVQSNNQYRPKITVNEDAINKELKQIKEERERKTNKPILPSFDNLPIQLFYAVNSDVVDFNYEPYNSNFETNLFNLLFIINYSLENNENLVFEMNIKSSTYDPAKNSSDLAKGRSENFKKEVDKYIKNNFPKLINKVNISIEDPSVDSLISIELTNENINSESSINKRNTSIISVIPILVSDNTDTKITENSIEDDNKSEEIKTNDLEQVTVRAERITEELVNNNGTFNKIKTKTIQNGIMTYTPYDLYNRLTFLHQCTRQGRTQISEGISNSVFGRPPIIVFKLGDMYNTKAIITSLNLSFENEIPWDLNPEGFGVQKMGCKVTMNMNLIGGSSLDDVNGPKKHILNADSRRFYANSSYETDNNKLDIEE